MSVATRSPFLALPLLALLALPLAAQEPEQQDFDAEVAQEATTMTPEFLTLYQSIQAQLDATRADIQDEGEETASELAQLQARIQQLEMIRLNLRQLAIRLNSISGIDPLQSLRLDALQSGLHSAQQAPLVPGGKAQQLQQIRLQLQQIQQRFNSVRVGS